VAGERQSAAVPIHPEDRDIVGALVADVEELAAGSEVEASRVVAAGPFFCDERQFSVRTDREDADAVMEAVARIDKPSITGNQDLRAEVASGESGRQRGYRLAR
jgi:hypothetical protein